MPGTSPTSVANLLPPQIARRAELLSDLRLLDQAANRNFDRVARLAAHMFSAPIALVTLITSDRQWFKARVGTDHHDVDLALTFCIHTMRQDDVMIVNDVFLDPRFSNNELIASEALRSYAGLPFNAPDGTVLGTLCVLDRVPRAFEDTQLAALRDLRAIVEAEIAALEEARAVERGRERDAWTAALLEHMPDGVLILDAKGFIVSLNLAAARIFRCGLDELVGRAAQEFVTSSDLQHLRSAAPINDLFPYEATGLRNDGSSFPAEFTMNRIQHDDRQFIVVVLRDISVRRLAEERGRAIDERRSKYFATATHELRTPMASVLGFSELLLKRDFDAATTRELTEIIHRQASRLVALINQLLDLARIEAGGREGLRLQSLAAPELIEQTLAGLDGLGEGDRIEVVLAEGVLPLYGDAGKLQQALTNLLSNAIKYSAPGTPIVLSAFPTVDDHRPMIAFRVSDEGIGMNAEQRARLFDAFYRADDASPSPGSGLGMTIFKEVVDVHGGTVTVESALGIGTAITMAVPVSDEGRIGG